jgi:regulator of protease activity HflC (stomatin/prohibitin superfamily)
MIKEIPLSPYSGWLILPFQLIALPAIVFCLSVSISTVAGAKFNDPSGIPIGIAGIVICAILVFLWFFNWAGFFVVNPNQSRVVLFFGRYQGSVRAIGFHYVNPFSSKKLLSLRIRTFETGSQSSSEVKDPASGRVVVAAKRGRGHPIKVNDLDGNPIEIAAVVVWRVIDTAEALFNVEAFDQYVETQSEAALRNLASHYHYDSSDDSAMSLRGNTDSVGEKLQAEIAARLSKVGIEILEARISSLAYAPEIAAAMLQRQQAGAVVAARQRIVDGAVGMVELALARLEEKKTVELNSAQKASMIANLLVVLCSERGAQPVVSTSSQQE